MGLSMVNVSVVVSVGVVVPAVKIVVGEKPFLITGGAMTTKVSVPNPSAVVFGPVSVEEMASVMFV